MRLLVVEDDIKAANVLRRGFEQENYSVDVAHDGQTGLELAEGIDYDLAVLDVMLPKLSGLELLSRIKQKKPNLLVLILTAKDTLEDRVHGLNLGADDYLVKPFAFAELSARTRALLRRGSYQKNELQVADLRLDTAARTVIRAGKKIDLSAKEFAILEFLMRHAGHPVTRSMIIQHVWDPQFDSVTNVVDVYIKYLRNKVDKGFSPQLIHTVRGVGYIVFDQKK